jgi:hypothetical protein
MLATAAGGATLRSTLDKRPAGAFLVKSEEQNAACNNTQSDPRRQAPFPELTDELDQIRPSSGE